MRRVIRLGDPTSHGGAVVSAAGNYSIMSKAVARMGDSCTCPKLGHNNCTIAEGDPNWTIDGRAVALEGHKTSCGAELISTCSQLGRSYEGDGEMGGLGFRAYPANQFAESVRENAEQLAYDEHFILIDDRSGEPAQKFEFHVAGQSQTAQTGVTNAAGRTALIQSDTPEQATLKARQTEIVIG